MVSTEELKNRAKDYLKSYNLETDWMASAVNTIIQYQELTPSQHTLLTSFCITHELVEDEYKRAQAKKNRRW